MNIIKIRTENFLIALDTAFRKCGVEEVTLRSHKDGDVIIAGESDESKFTFKVAAEANSPFVGFKLSYNDYDTFSSAVPAGTDLTMYLVPGTVMLDLGDCEMRNFNYVAAEHAVAAVQHDPTAAITLTHENAKNATYLANVYGVDVELGKAPEGITMRVSDGSTFDSRILWKK